MLGYFEHGGRAWDNVTRESAKEIAKEHNLLRFQLVPHPNSGERHNAYERTEDGEYTGISTRDFVYSSMITPPQGE
jgi:hypothetical protein